MRILTWNLFHGRSVPAAGRSLLAEFAGLIGGWSWDVALLQEVPPWWPRVLGDRSGAEAARALTSRNLGAPIRRAAAERFPDLIRSNGGGCNAVLVREPWKISACRTLRLRTWPERRVAQLARLTGGVTVANLHASTRRELAREELGRLGQEATAWAGKDAVVLGGDLNLREPAIPGAEFARGASHGVDHLFLRGLVRLGEAQVADRRVDLGRQGRRRMGAVALSDHEPLLLECEREPGDDGRGTRL